MKVGTAEEYMPQTGKKERCVCFNYYEEGKPVNTKFRDGAKNFKMVAGAEVIPYNIDGIKGMKECIITEGEIDALSFAEIGRTDVISVPTGANKNLTWMDRFVQTHLEDKRVIYVATDADRKGQELGKELSRRLGASRCRVVSYPDDCKDANEVLVKHGKEALTRVLAEAPEIPLEGVFTITDVVADLRALFEKGMERGAETGWEDFDRYCTFETGRLCVATGIPGAGKSEFIDELVMRLNIRHGWKVAYFSPENMPLTYHLRKLMEKVTGQRFKASCMTEAEYAMGETYLAKNFSFILPKDNFTVENILGTATELVGRKGIKILTVDPFNRFEHQIPAGQTETQYISAVLDKFTNFAVRNNCLVIIVAHPRKMYKDPGTLREPVPTLYDINGSAAFYNKCDFGFTVERDYNALVTRIHILKVKFRHLGENGKALFKYNTTNGRYVPCEIVEHTGEVRNALFDNRGWGVES
jgi:twinkle protein